MNWSECTRLDTSTPGSNPRAAGLSSVILGEPHHFFSLFPMCKVEMVLTSQIREVGKGPHVTLALQQAFSLLSLWASVSSPANKGLGPGGF